MLLFNHRTPRSVGAIIVAAIVFGAFGANTVKADNYFVSATFTGPGTCSNTSLSVPIFETWNLPTSGTSQRYTEQLNGVVLNSGVSPFYKASGQLGPLPVTPQLRYNAAQPYTFVETADVFANGAVLAKIVLTIRCNNNVAIGTVANSQAGATPAPGSVTTQPLPTVGSSVFGLHTITCNVPLYDQPGGNVISGTLVTSGQTWFIAQGVWLASNGSAWSAINVGNVIIAYIPTSCVN